MESSPFPDPWRVVLDTSCFISGVRSRRGAAAALIRLALNRRLTIVMDLKLSLEYEAVALRKSHFDARGLSAADVLELVQSLRDTAQPVRAVTLLRPLSPDPDDDMILELAASAHVDAIVTVNTRHLAHAAQALGILVLTPGDLLAKLERSKA